MEEEAKNRRPIRSRQTEWAAYLGWSAALFSVMAAYVRLLGGSCGLE